MGYSSDAELYRLGLRVWQDCPRREEAGREYPFCRGTDAETVVRSFTYQPDNLFAAT